MPLTAYTADIVSDIKDILKQLIPQYFGSTLARETDIVNIVAALIKRESSFNPDAIGIPVSTRKGTGGARYLSSSAISSALATSSPTETINIQVGGVQAMGLMQVMGWNFVRGGSPSGRCEIERLRPDLAGLLCVNPGDSIPAAIVGSSNISKALLAGLTILEGKYKAVQQNGDIFYFKNDSRKHEFSSKISAAVGAYLGLGIADALGTTAESYVQSIVGGEAYLAANGIGNNPKISNSVVVIASNNGPSTNGSGRSRIGVAGCTPSSHA